MFLETIRLGRRSSARCRDLENHGKKAWSITQCCFKTNSDLDQFEMKNMVGCIPLGVFNPTDKEGLKFFSEGSWSGRSRVGGCAAVALDVNFIVRCTAWFNSECDSGFGVELRGIVAALRLAYELGCTSAYFLFDSVEVI